eukprot:TRINITY_DN257_c0_g1_i1.p1 TRINITY_DN257_c0_g1~~TRINITY_DN257_c0_g1_i1.p1  ORF type:complete len:204 (-),score=29.37 TRINITY_DN257_c0_g1_i1:175-786(-)
MSHAYRVVVVGAGGVGKSCLTIQYIANRFVADYDPTLEDSYRKQTTVGDAECILDIIDTAGQDDFMAIRESYYKDGDGFIIVYDVTQRTTYADVPEFHAAILRVKDTSTVPCILVGNKADMEDKRKIARNEAEGLAKKLQCRFIETSAKQRKNVDEMFTQLVEEILQTRKRRSAETDHAAPTNVRNSSKDDKREKKSGRCALF